MIDADWTIGRERADVAGKILADALLNREQVRSTQEARQAVGSKHMSRVMAPLDQDTLYGLKYTTLKSHTKWRQTSILRRAPKPGYRGLRRMLFFLRCSRGSFHWCSVEHVTCSMKNYMPFALETQNDKLLSRTIPFFFETTERFGFGIAPHIFLLPIDCGITL